MIKRNFDELDPFEMLLKAYQVFISSENERYQRKRIKIYKRELAKVKKEMRYRRNEPHLLDKVLCDLMDTINTRMVTGRVLKVWDRLISFISYIILG